jgi:hypothetical protein
MRFLFTILGIAASIGQSLSRVRINFIPLNWPIMIGLGVLTTLCAMQTSEGLYNNGTPRSASLKNLEGSDEDAGRNFVSIKGLLSPPLFHRGDSTTHVYSPLLDRKSGQCILVEIGEGDSVAKIKDVQVVTVQGMLITPEKEFSQQIQADKKLQKFGIDEKIFINPDYIFKKDATPGNPFAWICLTALCGTTLLAFIATFCMRYIVFQKMGGTQTITPEAGAMVEMNVRFCATGYFQLAPGDGDRFLTVPAGFLRDNDGLGYIVANIDASPLFFCTSSGSRVGYWTVPLGEPDGRVVTYGRLYVSFRSLPAVKIPFQGYNGKKDTTILSFRDEQDRDVFVQVLRQKKGTQAPTD